MTRDLSRRLDKLDQGAPPPPRVPRTSRGDKDPRKRFPIDVKLTSLSGMSAVAWAAIEAANDPPRWFRVGATPVRLVDATDDEPARTEDIRVDAMSHISARTAFWHKHSERDGQVEQFPLERVMKDMLAEPDPPLPPLRRIVASPVFGPDGTVSTQPGYNPSSQNYFADSGLTVPEVPEHPTDADIEAARSLLLDELLGDFPFVGPSERAHALSLVLNPFIRDMIEGPTPMYLIEAPAAGTGKGLLAHVAMLPALGRSAVLMPPAANEEETRKRITTALMGLPEAVLLDNIPNGLASPSLAAALTAPVWTDRVLGRSESRSLRVRTTWIATGNNPSQSNEMSRRVIRIRLDAGVERPEERRSFRIPNLEQWARQNRGRLIHACLTLVQAWLSREAILGDTTLGSYDEWAQLHGGILREAGVPGFLENRRESVLIAVSEDQAWAEFTQAWWKEYKDREVSTSDLYEIAVQIPDLPLGRSSSDRGQRNAFGFALKKVRDRYFGGLQITFTRTSNRAAMYRLQRSEEAPF